MLPRVAIGGAGALGTVLGIADADATDAGPAPFAFVAVTVHVYVLPFVRPATTSGDAAPLADPGVPPFADEQFAVKLVIALPPSNGGANETVSCALPDATTGWAGASGTRFGTAATDAGDAGPVPLAFVAVSVQEYDLPFVRPSTSIGDAGPPADPGAPPFDETQVTSYSVIALPPSSGATNETEISSSPGATVGRAGADGTVLGTTAPDAGDAAPVPLAFVAFTVHVYNLPFVKPLTTIGEPAPDAV
jgi:hypothetical protein